MTPADRERIKAINAWLDARRPGPRKRNRLVEAVAAGMWGALMGLVLGLAAIESGAI